MKNRVVVLMLAIGLTITGFYNNSIYADGEYDFKFGYDGGIVNYDISNIFETEGLLDPLLTNVNELPNYINASYNDGTVIFNVGDGQVGHDVTFDNIATKDAALFFNNREASLEIYLNNDLTINVYTVTLQESLNEYFGIYCNGRLWIKGNGTLTINFISESNNNTLSSYTMHGIAKYATDNTSEIIIGSLDDSSQRSKIIIKDYIDHSNSIYDTVGISLLPCPSSLDYTQTYFIIRNTDINIESNKYGIFFHDPTLLHSHSIDMMNSNLIVTASGPCKSDYIGLCIDIIYQQMENEDEKANIEINVWKGSNNVGIKAYGILDIANSKFTINKELSPEGDFAIIMEGDNIAFGFCDVKISGCISAKMWFDLYQSDFFIEDMHRCIKVTENDNFVFLLLRELNDRAGRMVVYGNDEDDYCIELEYSEDTIVSYEPDIEIKNLASTSVNINPNENIVSESMEERIANIKKYKNILYNDGNLMLVYDEDGNIIGSDLILPNQTIEIPDVPIKEGYKFLYWYNDDPEVPFDFDKPLVGDIHLQAKWEKLPDPKPNPVNPVPSYVIPKTGIE